MEFCFEHGEVETFREDESEVERCVICERATSTTPEEAARYEAQDKGPDGK